MTKGQAWQDNTVFEAVAGVGGAKYYKEAFVDLDMDALAVRQLTKYSKYSDNCASLSM